MTVVFDTNVVVSGIIWSGASRQCLVAWAHRRFALAVTKDILEEYTRVVQTVALQAGDNINWQPWIQWIENKAKVVDEAPLGKQRSRDPKDDIFLACALGCGAKIVVSRDRDLLILGKPFGVEVMEPGEFLKRVADDQSC